MKYLFEKEKIINNIYMYMAFNFLRAFSGT